MPIQFRCEYCRQRLGIADSKAGALVDCPACGRSLKVPGGGGAPGPSATGGKAEPDPHLQSALLQLSAIGLGPGADAETPPASTHGPSTPAHRIVPRKAANAPISPAKHSTLGQTAKTTAAPDPLKELAALPAAAPEDLPLVAEPELLEDTGGDEDGQAESANQPPETTAGTAADSAAEPLAKALAELAAQPSPASPAPPAQPRSGLRKSFPVLIPLLTGLLMFIAGYLTGNSASSRPAALESPPIAASGQSPSADPDSLPVPQPVAAGRISGLIEAASTDGKTAPDAGALVIIAPARNPGDLRLDGRFLRDAPDTPGRLAITAALEQLGVRFMNAGEDGTYSLPLPLPDPGPCVLIVVSRRNARPASAPLPTDVAAALQQWFTAPSPVTGRLQTVVQTIAAAEAGTGVRQNITIPAM